MAPSREMQPLGQVNVGTEVECPREAGDDEYERCKVKSLDSATGILDLDFGDGFVRKGVSVSEIKFLETSFPPQPAAPSTPAPAGRRSDVPVYWRAFKSRFKR